MIDKRAGIDRGIYGEKRCIEKKFPKYLAIKIEDVSFFQSNDLYDGSIKQN
jgi:hypothetical protein